MSHVWWSLPGPHRFVAQICESIRNGENVLVFLPLFSPPGLKTACQDYLHSFGSLLEQCPEDDITGPPGKTSNIVESLVNHYLPHTDPSAIWNAQTLVQDDSFAGRLFWVEVNTQAQWASWHDFVAAYAHAVRQRSLYDRSLFIIAITGIKPPEPPIEDVFLSQYVWRNYVDYLDMLLYSVYLTDRSGGASVERQLRCALLADLAVWDATMVEMLADVNLEDLHHPDEILLGIAHCRRWDTLELTEYCWEKGVINLVRGEDSDSYHSAALVLSDLEALEGRIWNAQISVLFPYIETKRKKLLTRHRAYLPLPHKRKNGEIVQSYNELEVGDIAFLLRNSQRSGIPLHIKEDALLLAESRNALAHLQVVDTGRVMSLITATSI